MSKSLSKRCASFDGRRTFLAIQRLTAVFPGKIMSSFANGLFRSKTCMSSREPDHVEVTDAVSEELEDEGCVRSGRRPEEEEEEVISETIRNAREMTEVSEDASSDGHRNLLMCMGSRPTNEGRCEVDEDFEAAGADDFSQASDEEGSSESRLSSHGPCRDIYLKSKFDNGAGVWEWLCCNLENGDCSTAESDDQGNGSAKEDEEQGNGHVAEDDEQCAWQCGTCGCCRRATGSSEGEGEMAGGEGDPDESPELSACDLQAAETSSGSTCVPSIPETRFADDLRNPESSTVASRAASYGKAVTLTSGAASYGKAVRKIVIEDRFHLDLSERLAKAHEEELRRTWPKTDQNVCTVVSLDDCLMGAPVTVASI